MSMADIKTPEELADEYCKYCEHGDIKPSIHWMCEGRWCTEAYANYLEYMEDDENV